jgi:hypothetical protein
VAVKKSELVRAALLLLASEPTKRLLAAVKAVEPVKTGRPPKAKGAAHAARQSHRTVMA